jgi:hypothetical protein
MFDHLLKIFKNPNGFNENQQKKNDFLLFLNQEEWTLVLQQLSIKTRLKLACVCQDLRQQVQFTKLDLYLHDNLPTKWIGFNGLCIMPVQLHQLFEVFSTQFQNLRELSINDF